MELLAEYGLFLAKTLTLVIAILFVIICIIAISTKGKIKQAGKVTVKKLNDKYKETRELLEHAVLDKKQLKAANKVQKQQAKQDEKNPPNRKRIFVIHFHGDIRASHSEQLSEEVTAILTIAKPEDEVLACIESGGGLVHAYGYCASQLNRFRENNIPLTVAIDKVAASGGYMMASVANRIIAAPFAIIGSIGVLAQIPNFHRLLKHNRIDFEQLSAGEYKRTLTVFGENSQKARKKMIEELEDIHHIFKQHIKIHRPELDMDTVATGEHWLACKAQELKLVDSISTSDEFLLKASNDCDIYAVCYQRKKGLPEKMGLSAKACIDAIQNKLFIKHERYC